MKRTLPIFLAISMLALPGQPGLRAVDALPPVPPGSPVPPAANSGASTTPSATQSSPSPSGGNPGKGHRLKELQEKLGLKNDQVRRLRPILKHAAEQIKTVRASSLDEATKHQKIKVIKAAARDQIRPILTPEQLAKWKELRAQHHKA